MIDPNISVSNLIKLKSSEKVVFTAGPAAICKENILSLNTCFGRGDSDYEQTEKRVLENIRKISGLPEVIRFQGSATLSLEIMALNFLAGKILLIDTGYYSDRFKEIVACSKFLNNEITEIHSISWLNLDQVVGCYDWVIACYIETSCGLKLDLPKIKLIADKIGAKLMLDATASIGLEENHDLANVIGYSSCKGLFGLTGAAFISYCDEPTVEVQSFYLNFSTHREKKITGPYHTIQSLDLILARHEEFKFSVLENKKVFSKKFKNYLYYSEINQPNLCTFVSCNIQSKNNKAILYKPRLPIDGDVVCHLGEVNRGLQADGAIIDLLECDCD